MDNENHKKTWDGFTKFVLWGTISVILVLILLALFFLLKLMIIGSISENIKLEKRVAITPDIVKKYKSLGLEVHLSKDYAIHLGISDKEYIEGGASILKQ